MIQVVNRALDILELVGRDSSRLYTLNEISTTLELNKATCANIIKTLVSRGYLVQDGRMTGYKLGSMAYMLTGNHLFKEELLSAAVGPMNELSKELNESSILAVLERDIRLVLYEANSTHELQVINKKEKEAYQTSTGRMILACMEREKQNEFITKYGLPASDVWMGVQNETDLLAELDKIRGKQVAIQISAKQIVGIAMPLFIQNNIAASLGVYLPQSRYTPPMQEKIQSEISKYQAIINHNLMR